MAIIYFKDNLINEAEHLIKAKGTVDKIKAADDIDKIDAVLFSYLNGFGYNQQYAEQLDKRLYDEYFAIQQICTLHSPKAPYQSNRAISPVEQTIANLKIDRFGIIIDVMVKEGFAESFMHYIDRVE